MNLFASEMGIQKRCRWNMMRVRSAMKISLVFFFRGHSVNTMHPKKQYKSAIMFHNQEQKEIAAKVLREKKMGVSEQDLLQPASSWHDAEEYHQKYTQRQNFWFYGD
mmetsp:Transcript_146555/g.255717  ORF Transcript_146555/g.255717 Transcript_146555/m.255717 type:complete len:107 (-) Transcript_146555:48-368(-)